MLSLTLLKGEYFTIGDDIVIQIRHTSEDRCKLTVHAPRDIPVIRGELLERRGEKRPDFVVDTPSWTKQKIRWNSSKSQTLAAMRKLLSQMDSWDSNVKTLRRQLNYMFPPDQEAGKAEQTTEVSNV